jgi:heme-degrading monooxygenase HmoA
MAYVLVHSKVEDYNKWKPMYDDNANIRRAAGSKGSTIFRSKDDSNEVVILLEWDNFENARKFANSTELRERMQQAGVIGKPEILFLDEITKTKA